MTTTATKTRPNTYAGTCTGCRGNVPAGVGQLGAKVGGRWTVKHTDCSLAGSLSGKAAPQRTAAPAAPAATCENCGERSARYAARDSSGLTGRVCGPCYGDRYSLSFA